MTRNGRKGSAVAKKGGGIRSKEDETEMSIKPKIQSACNEKIDQFKSTLKANHEVINRTKSTATPAQDLSVKTTKSSKMDVTRQVLKLICKF